MSFEEESSTTCPRCGQIVPSGNAYCGTCGAPVPRVPFTRGVEPTSSAPTVRRPEPQQYPKYDRKFSTFGRLTKLLTSPKEAMEDIGQAPDYGGVITLFVIWTIVSAISSVIILQKLQFTGPYGNFVNSGVAAGMATVVVLLPIVIIVRWLVKSYLIRHMCDSHSWDFETAASVTGYAYLPNIIFGVIGIFVVWLLMPSIVIDTVDLDQALIQMDLYTAQTFWITIGLSTLFSLAALFWKSYLGSHGTYYGTHKNYETGSAFGIFIIVGGIGFLIDFFSSFI
ncbi:MAG: YIP1 family protein [Candidatus Thorarchaeota archaeon]